MAQSTNVAGLQELNKVLEQLPDKLQDRAVKNAMAAGARVIRDEAKRLVPVGPGPHHLRDDIVVARKVKKTRTRKGSVVVGIRNEGRFYAHLVEFGTSHSAPHPFMRPALDNAQSAAIQKIGPKLGQEVEKQAAKLNKMSGAKRRKAFR
jgi:HK97 gp10 family phage protein